MLKVGDVVLITRKEPLWDSTLNIGTIHAVVSTNYITGWSMLNNGLFTTPNYCVVINDKLTELEKIIYGVSDEL